MDKVRTRCVNSFIVSPHFHVGVYFNDLIIYRLISAFVGGQISTEWKWETRTLE